MKPRPDTSPDAQIARGIARGDRHVFEQVFETYFRRVHSFCARRTGSRAAAEQATQQILTEVFARLPEYTAEEPLAVWVLRIARRSLPRAERPSQPPAPSSKMGLARQAS